MYRPANEFSKDTVSTVDQLEFVSKELKQLVCKIFKLSPTHIDIMFSCRVVLVNQLVLQWVNILQLAFQLEQYWCLVGVCILLCVAIFILSCGDNAADTKQHLRACLTPPSGPEKFGAVSAVAINFDSTRLLIGYARGPVSNWYSDLAM